MLRLIVPGSAVVLLAFVLSAPAAAQPFQRVCQQDATDPTCWFCADLDLTGAGIACRDLSCPGTSQCTRYTTGGECCVALTTRECCEACTDHPPGCSGTRSCSGTGDRCRCSVPATDMPATCMPDGGMPVVDAGPAAVDAGPARVDAEPARIDAGPAQDAGVRSPTPGLPPGTLLRGSGGCTCRVARAPDGIVLVWLAPAALLLRIRHRGDRPRSAGRR